MQQGDVTIDDWIAELDVPVATLGAVEADGHDKVFEYIVQVVKRS